MGNMRESFLKNRTLIITLSVLAVLYILAIQGMSTKDWVITTLRGLSVGAVTFLVASGLSLIFGLMDVLNLAHGSLFMIGAYIGWSAFIRPDTFLDIFPVLVLILIGFMLLPLWEQLISRLNLPKSVERIWPWVGIVLGIIILGLLWPRYPIAIWNSAAFDDSPVTWTQNYTNGLVNSLVEPAIFTDISPIFAVVGLLLIGILFAASLAGLLYYRRKSAMADEFKTPWVTITAVIILFILSLIIILYNDQITYWVLNLSSNALFVFAVVTALLCGAGLGALMESTLIRPLYVRPIYQLMLTLGLGVIGIELVRTLWGRSGFTMPKPGIFDGSGEGCPAETLGSWIQNNCSTLIVTISGEETRIRVYNEVFLIIAGFLVLVIVWALLRYSRIGMTIRAGVQDSEMVEALGINVRRVFTMVFALGAALAALGGVLSAPATGLSNLMGESLLLTALIALAIGGLTSFPGSALGAVIVGLLQQFIIKYGQIGIQIPFTEITFKPTPPLVPATTVLLMVIILLIMPQGLLGRKE